MGTLNRGQYDKLITEFLRDELSELPKTLVAVTEKLGQADAIEYLAREIALRLRSNLNRVLSDNDEDHAFLAVANELLASIEPNNHVELEVLSSIRDAAGGNSSKPLIPLSQSALITNEQGLNYQAILRSELLSANRVDWICPFIGNQGLSLIIDLLADFGDRLRVITTTYLGGTNHNALVRIANCGAQVKIVYERPEQKTSLHAKAWIFHRDSGYSTATIGSSNLSRSALVDGLEWNVRLGQSDSIQVLDELKVTFERLWLDPLFESFDANRDSEKLSRALKVQRTQTKDDGFVPNLTPLPHQQEALDELAYARLEGKDENLIVAATGIGKTLLAAFDYRRLASQIGGRPKLLFIAHRSDILHQSLRAFQAVMKDSDFGELNVGQDHAEVFKHVFASVQSKVFKNLDQIARDHFDIIVIDEFHHAEASTYLKLLNHFKPKQLIGLTATPERTDGKNVIDRFGTPTFELRLWHALDQKLLCPFHYFGIDDGTDLSHLTWTAGRYSDGELNEQFITYGEDRAAVIVRELTEKVADIDRMRTVAFCATKLHANYMAEKFQAAGIEAMALHSGHSDESQEEIKRRFRQGSLPIICTVDLFNEGIDIPQIDTVLFLRPTESATVFIQQLGRGLRNHIDKGALTVLDFVGNQNRKFRMDLRFRAMTGFSRTNLEKAVEADFPFLPPGCNIRLDRQTKKKVLANLKQAIPSSDRNLIDELRRMIASGSNISLESLLAETGLEISDFYRNHRSFAKICKAAGILNGDLGKADRASAFCHIDDRDRIEKYRLCISDPENSDNVFERMLSFPFNGSVNFDKTDETARSELLELFNAIFGQTKFKPLVADDLPFALHSSYSRDEIVSPFRNNPSSMMQGTFHVKEYGLDVHLLTLRKSERDFAPTTRYHDYFTGASTLHWESQSTTSQSSPTGQRLIYGKGRHLFFVRENKNEAGRSSPYLCLGFGHPSYFESEKPIKLVWELEHNVPAHLYPRLRNAAG